MSFNIIRNQYILIQQRVIIPFLKTVHFSLAAMYLSFVTPGRIGEVSKGYFIHKAYGAPLNKLFSGVLLDRFFDVYALLLTSFLGFVITKPAGINPAPIILIIILTASSPFFFIKIIREMSIDFSGWIQKKITGSDTWSGHIQEIFSEIDSLLNWKIFWALAITFASYFFFFGSCYFLSLSIGIPLPYYKIAFYIACANILSFLPISFAGIGTREASLVYLFSIENLPGESALAFSTLVFLFTYILTGIIGFLCFMTLKHNNKSLPDNA